MAHSTHPVFDDSLISSATPSVIAEWTDYNDHFNVAYYVQAFDLAAQAFRHDQGINLPFEIKTNRVSYLREVPGGRKLTLTTQLIGFTDKGLHTVQALYAEPERYLAAVEERLEMPISGTAEDIAQITSVLKPILDAHVKIALPEAWNTF
ncbi:thioesterase family protein [Hwanghaeella sp. LZ110]|uniref:thioesterase family protein n=1 Tax=Hwanghaeella sp. LZ110 TaxID=3402810 RepID=UPI003B679554